MPGDNECSSGAAQRNARGRRAGWAAPGSRGPSPRLPGGGAGRAGRGLCAGAGARSRRPRAGGLARRRGSGALTSLPAIAPPAVVGPGAASACPRSQSAGAVRSGAGARVPGARGGGARGGAGRPQPGRRPRACPPPARPSPPPGRHVTAPPPSARPARPPPAAAACPRPGLSPGRRGAGGRRHGRAGPPGPGRRARRAQHAGAHEPVRHLGGGRLQPQLRAQVRRRSAGRFVPARTCRPPRAVHRDGPPGIPTRDRSHGIPSGTSRPGPWRLRPTFGTRTRSLGVPLDARRLPAVPTSRLSQALTWLAPSRRPCTCLLMQCCWSRPRASHLHRVSQISFCVWPHCEV